MPNRQNTRYYSDSNPHFTRAIESQRRWKVNVWGGIIGQYIIGPHFLNGILTGDAYLQFLQRDLPPLLENVPLEVRANMWLQQDGAPCHYTRAVRSYIDEHFENKWIGRGGPISWPARSPDLNKLDFFFCGDT